MLAPGAARSAQIYESDDRVGVLYLAPWVDLGGSDKGTIDWFRTIDRSRFRPYLVTTQPSANRFLWKILPYAEEVWDLPDLMPGAMFPRFLLDFVVSRRIDVVHIMNSRLAFDMLIDFALLDEAPAVVVQLHAEEPDRTGYVPYVATRYANLVDAFSVTSEHLRQTLVAYDVPASRISVITTGVDTDEEFNPGTVDPLPDVERDQPSILWPGRFVEQKDPLLALDVIREVARRGLRARLHLVGEGPLEPEIRRRTRDLGIEPAVLVHPPSQEMARWYRSVDAVLMTSRFEGIPYVLFEALAMGVPVIAPALPGNRELLDADSGCLVEPRDDVTAYGDALARVIRNPARARAMGAHGRRSVRAKHGLQRTARQHEELYARLASRVERFTTRDDPDPPAPGRDLGRRPAAARTVAVIVPCFEHGRFLRECLASVERQTLTAAEVVVADDASADAETLGALQEVERQGLARVVRLERHQGPSAARNRALEATSSAYVLTLDADDLLYETALQEMVLQLERADERTAFIYPNAQHFGNRHDYVVAPEFNLYHLLNSNFVYSASLFDARVFADGVRYDEGIVLGHEDWDLVLQIAERGWKGAPAHGRTFQYRRRGFSRVDAVLHRSDLDDLRVRHPALYGMAEQIKARWAPALSVVVSSEDHETDARQLAEGLSYQTCLDHELVVVGEGPEDRAPAVTVAITPPTRPPERVAHGVRAARGRFVLLAGAGSGGLFDRPSTVEQLLRALTSHPPTCAGIVFATTDDPTAPPLRQIDASEAHEVEPVAVAWSRDPARRRRRPLRLGLFHSPIHDVILGLEDSGLLQWRVAGAPRS